MDKKSSKATASTSGKKRKAGGKKTTKKGAGQSSSKKPKEELDVDLLLETVKKFNQDRHDEINELDRYEGVQIKQYGSNKWTVTDFDECTVKHVQIKCKKGQNCESYCPDCKVCKHQIKCDHEDCEDGKYLCVHAHLVGNECTFEGVDIEEDSESDADESEEEEEEEDKISATIMECKSLLNDKKAEEILQKNLDQALFQLQAHGQKLKKEDKSAKKK